MTRFIILAEGQREVTACCRCPMFKMIWEGDDWCSLANCAVPDGDVIPDWCPLPAAPKEAK